MRRPTDGPARTLLVALFALLPACSRAPQSAAAAASPSPSAAGEDLARPLPSPVPDVVARVNGQPIRLAQLLPAAKIELRRPSVAGPEQRKAEALRRALGHYVERELLLQEALARGISADDRQVQWAYDQLRRGHGDEAAWEKYLAGEGLDAQAFRAELRVQQTVAALLDQEARARSVTPDAARAALVEKLRAAGRVELFL